MLLTTCVDIEHRIAQNRMFCGPSSSECTDDIGIYSISVRGSDVSVGGSGSLNDKMSKMIK